MISEKEFLELFGKTTLIEHLTKNQQRELYETVKGLIPEQKVKEVLHTGKNPVCTKCSNYIKKRLGLE